MLNIPLQLTPHKGLLVALLSLLFSTAPLADETNYPVLQAPLVEVGKAKFKVLFWDIYHSRLLSHNGQYDRTPPYVLEIQYLRDIEKKDLLDRTIEQWQHLELAEAVYQDYIPLIDNLWPDIVKGDKLALLVTKDGSTFLFNDQLLGNIEDPEFSEHFLAIWLDEKTSQPKLRQKLIGKNNAK